MPPYENQSMHDMHGLLQQLDTLNAGHAPEHLEMFEGLKDAAKSMYKKGNDLVLSNTNRATEEEVIVHEFSNTPDYKKKEQMELLLVSNEIRDKYTHLLEIMVKSSTLKPLIMKEWYPNGIKEPLQRSVYAAMHPLKK